MIRLDNLYGMVKQDWTKQEILDEIDKVNNDFDTRLCENCRFNCSSFNCFKGIQRPMISILNGFELNPSFGCSEFKRKEK